jgi:ribosome-associated translation inhibitor RaiA
MQVPLQITFRHMSPSPAFETRVRELATRLERFSQQILRCHVVIEAPAGHHQHGEHFDIGLEIVVPGRQIVICRARPDPGHEDPYVALRNAFRAATRKLQSYERERSESRRPPPT